MEVQERATATTSSNAPTTTSKVYSLSSGPTIPEWLGERARRNLSKRDVRIRRRIELLQDLTMPVSSSYLSTSPDGSYLLAAGTYAPRIKCYELEELSMKFERYVNGEVLNIQFLGEDYGKFALLRNDRTIDFHAPYGHHTSIRLPTFGRGMAYEKSTCELLVAAGGNKNRTSSGVGGGEVYRVNLEEGRFAQPLAYNSSNKSSEVSVGGNCIKVSPTHALSALGCEDGLVRFWDNRIPYDSTSNISPLVVLDVTSATSTHTSSLDDNDIFNNYQKKQNQVTSLAFDAAGMKLVAGTSHGHVALYDMRSSHPLHIKEHRYNLPIHTVQFHKGNGNQTILSGDAKVIQIWRADSSSSLSSENSNLGATLSTIEGEADMSHFLTIGDTSDPTGQSSGLILCAGEQSNIQSYYCPVLGHAPKWCSHLDGITEELEEKDIQRRRRNPLDNNDDEDEEGEGVYDDYKFLTQNEIESLGIQNLVGTPLLRGYMHGFFIDAGLYSRIKAVANPFEYESYRKKKLKEKMDKKFASRISPRAPSQKKSKKKEESEVLVNAKLASRLESKQSTSKNSKSGKVASSLLKDDRFGSLFTNPDYEIDEEDFQFKLRNPSGVAKNKVGEDDEEDNRNEDMDSDAEDSDESDGGGGEVEGFSRVNVGSDEEGGWGNEDSDEDEEDESESDDDDYDDDGFKGGKIRGEKYSEMKALSKQSKQKKKLKEQNKKKKKERSKKNVMYEADEYAHDGSGSAVAGGGDNAAATAALGIGLGDASATDRVKQMKVEMSMSLGERLEKRKKKRQLDSILNDGDEEDREYALPGGGVMAKMKKGVGGSMREVSYIPRDAKKKMDGGGDDEERCGGGRRGRRSDGRKRRGVKDLGFKTPFKNQG